MCTVPLSLEQAKCSEVLLKEMQLITARSIPRRSSFNSSPECVSKTRIKVPDPNDTTYVGRGENKINI
jgi:hypothetical protein